MLKQYANNGALKFIVRNKWAIISLMLIYIFLNYVITFGALGIKKYSIDLSDVEISCLEGANQLVFRMHDDRMFVTSRRFKNCSRLLRELKEKHVFARHSRSGFIYELRADNTLIYSKSPQFYVIPYTVIVFVLARGIYSLIRRRYGGRK